MNDILFYFHLLPVYLPFSLINSRTVFLDFDFSQLVQEYPIDIITVYIIINLNQLININIINPLFTQFC